MDQALKQALDRSGRASRETFGRRLDCFLPGMFVQDGRTGLYPAVSLTGDECALACEHCRGRLLKTMIPARSPEELWAAALDLEQRGRLGLLVSGGSDRFGRLPWDGYLDVLERITRRGRLIVTVHAGMLDRPTARRLKDAGVRQALVDVIGDDETARRVYHLEKGTAPIWETLAALAEVELEVAPHVVLGLDYGRITGEYRAVERLADFGPRRLVTVVLSPLSGTPMKGLAPPPVEEAVRFLIAAGEILPRARRHLGCARPRGLYRRALDPLAVRAGINALALPADEALIEAERLGLRLAHAKTCCSLAGEPLPGQKGEE